MKSLLKPNISEGENTCKCCIYFEEKNSEGYCSLKNKKTNEDGKCRKFELDIFFKTVKKKHKPLLKIDISDI